MAPEILSGPMHLEKVFVLSYWLLLGYPVA